jgi:hypothetical protein
MTKKNWFFFIFLMALAAVYVIWFTDWFKPKTIHISYTIRAIHYRRLHGDNGPSLIFGLEPAPVELTEIKVVSLADFQKNPGTLPVWHLVSDSNSVPVKNFIYGTGIRGMRPAIASSEPAELATNLVYRIFIKAGRAKGDRDFEIGNVPAEDTTGANP